MVCLILSKRAERYDSVDLVLRYNWFTAEILLALGPRRPRDLTLRRGLGCRALAAVHRVAEQHGDRHRPHASGHL
jgi:hypothetical protein